MLTRLILAVSIFSATSLPAREPIAIADRTCLFLDDRFIDEQSGLKRVWHPGKPRPEVAIAAEAGPWEQWPHLYGSVFRDPKDGLYKMYYESAITPARPGDKNSLTCYICYAESKDGKTWTKPILGLWEDLGSTSNNIVIPSAELANVFVDPLETDPAKRLKMFVHLAKPYPNPDGGVGECMLSSGDGLHWKFEAGFNGPGYADPAYARPYTDSYFFMWDPLTSRYRGYIRTFAASHVAEGADNRRRAIGVTESQKVNRDWAPVRHILAAEAGDDAKVARLSKDPAKPDWAELYCMHYFNYGNHYIGSLSLLYMVDAYDANGGSDLQLTFSHDAMTWFRQPERATLIAPSNAAPELFPTYVTTNEPLLIDNELWLYYTEANGAHPIAPSVGVARSQIRAATWRKDGFVSLDAAGRATLTTKLLAQRGRELLINFKTQPGGSIRVGLLDAHGRPIGQFTVGKCQPLTGDAVAAKVNWVLGSDFSKVAGDQPVRLMFELDRAQLWSFRFAQ